ncbi:MAG: hypothetical protein QXZ20_00915 [Candidatus Aenigmatarchaeota archaeon]
MNKYRLKLFLLALFLLVIFLLKSIISLADQTSNISLIISPHISQVSSSSESTRNYNIIIINKQNIKDSFDIFVSGNYPYVNNISLSSKSVEIPPGGRVTIKMTLKIPRNAMTGHYLITVSATSKSNQDVWISGNTFLNILGSGTKSYTHDQPPLIGNLGPVTSGGAIGVNYYGNMRFVDRGYIISNNGSCCVGSKMILDGSSLSAEWSPKGGPRDSPPVEWVENLEDVKRKIDSGIFSTKIYDAVICDWRALAERETGPERCEVRGTMICSSNCRLTYSNLLRVGETQNEFIILEEGEHKIEYNCPIDCIFFIDRRNMVSRYNNNLLTDVYGYLEVHENLTSINQTIVLNAKRGNIGPDLDIMNLTVNPKVLKEGGKFYIKIKLKNVGDMDSNIDNILLNLNEYEIIRSPKSIAPNDYGDIVIKARAENITNLKTEIKYSSDSIGCLPTKNFKEDFNVGEIKIIGKLKKCSYSSDCSSQEVCCEGYCMDTSTGFCDDLDGDGTPETWIDYI